MMLAALGDIHGNYTALETTLTWAKDNGITHLAFLGDYVTDCPYPRRTMRLLYEAQNAFETVFIRGNREDYMLGLAATADTSPGDTLPAFYGSRMGNIFSTYAHLSPDDIAFFAALPISTRVEYENAPALRLCHGSLDNNRTVVRPDRPSMAETLAALDTDFLLCAHSHLQFLYRDPRTGKTVINGGSVGHPCREKTTNAEFVVLTLENGTWSAQLHSLPYDIRAAVRDFDGSDFLREAGVWARAVRQTLLTGKNMTYAVLVTVARLRTEQHLPDNLSPTEEEPLWEAAPEILGIP